MKIESSLIAYQEKNNRLVSSSEDFRQWLDDAPAQQLKDYYRNHLSQLEPSALHFDRMEDPDAIAVSLANNITLATNRPTKIQTEMPVALNQQVNTREIIPGPRSFTSALNPSILQLKPTYEIKQVPYGTESSPLVKPDDAKHDASSLIQYEAILHETPNFHLFTEGQQIELALNTHSMSAHERKDLLHHLKLFFKKKGLFLKKLLLNGVTHAHTH